MRSAHKNTAPHSGALTNHKRVQGEVASGIQMTNQRRVVYARARSNLVSKTMESIVPQSKFIQIKKYILLSMYTKRQVLHSCILNQHENEKTEVSLVSLPSIHSPARDRARSSSDPPW